MNIERILIIGGDSRINYLSDGLMEDGFKVKIFDGSEPLKTAVEECDAVVLGLPCSRDDKTVDAPDLSESILLKDLFHIMGKNKLLLAGKMSQGTKAVADVFGVKWVDYFMREELEILNAVPTCEGALQIAMEELPITGGTAYRLCTSCFGSECNSMCKETLRPCKGKEFRCRCGGFFVSQGQYE